VTSDAGGELIVLDVAIPVVPATPEGEHWQGILSRVLYRWGELADEMPSTPDAALLVQALRAPADSVIRQLPSSAQDALALCEDVNLSRPQLAARLGKDPALVQSLLRTANSAAYAAGRKSLLSLDGAIERIGLTGTRAVVMAKSVEGLLSRPGGNYDAMLTDVWAHMVRTGPLARTIAPAFGIDRDETFSVALLHDVGKLVIFDQISAMRSQLRRPFAVPVAWLSAFIQETHASLGALAMLQWKMGARAAIAIGDHHRVDPAEGANEFAEVIHAAERLDHASRKGYPVDLESIWKTGRLSGSVEKTRAALAELAEA
jgi:HD-like signal output (HDOD) protein